MGRLSNISPYKGDGTTPLLQKWLDILYAALRGDITTDGLINGVGIPTMGTVQATTSGSTWQFTGIPSWVKQFDVSFDGVSLSGTDNLLIQLGDSGGFETSGYLSTSASIQDAATPGVSTSTAGFIIRSALAGDSIQGSYSFSLLDSSTNTWSGHGGFYRSSTSRSVTAGGSKSLSSTLTQVRVTVTGTDTGDAGKVGLIYR